MRIRPDTPGLWALLNFHTAPSIRMSMEIARDCIQSLFDRCDRRMLRFHKDTNYNIPLMIFLFPCDLRFANSHFLYGIGKKPSVFLVFKNMIKIYHSRLRKIIPVFEHPSKNRAVFVIRNIAYI